jgi:hypothetical protein
VLTNAEGRLAEWQAQDGARARPIGFNEMGNDLEPGRAICFSHRRNAGLVIEGDWSATHFTLGLILARDRRDPLTVAAFQPADAEGYTFISIGDGILRMGRKDGAAELSLPDPGGVILILFSVGDGIAALSANGGLPVQTALNTDGPGRLRLFLGCRGDARLLVNKLGPFRLSDVMLWPDEALLAEGVGGGAVVPAIRLWEKRRLHGI